MSRSSFMEFLEKRNRDFINLFSCESALGLVDTLREETSSDEKKQCIIVSFDPPLNSPPITFNWSEKDVWYFKEPSISYDFFTVIDAHIEKSKNPCIVFVEKKGLPHKRKIMRFIKNYKEQMFRNKSLEHLPRFILAEYRAPLQLMKFSELMGGSHDTLSS